MNDKGKKRRNKENRVLWRKGSLRNLAILEETYQNQHVAMDDDQLQSLK